ncbi:hypothetical protein [Janthinobacterium sp. RT4P48]|uniref:hypothetical protein n=1 Tax=Janthinobacterium sp. RT4P48 TaxID=3424188 RepID=UPI003F2496B4
MSIYRSMARISLKSALAELSSNDDQRLKYAALELRMTIESVTYDRALAYKDEFPPQEYATWQPKKIMLVLLELDPTADIDSTLSFGSEPELGERPVTMTSMGSESVFNLRTIKIHYDALGSFLHVSSMKHMGSPIDYVKMRKRCEVIATALGEVLASPVFNITLGNFARFDCGVCKKPIRKRIPGKIDTLDCNCFDCKASYTLTRLSDGRVQIEPHEEEIHCANKQCGHIAFVQRREIEKDSHWKCQKCNGLNVFRLSLFHIPCTSGTP